ncbi:MAG: hypothetical protein JWN62_4066, partial [Acidimicrobiales bacterium]|nr:hypothetical protein [Acidimicrobiales bacterium]
NELDHLDNHLVGIIAGRLRLLTKGTQSITVLNHDSWSASGFPGRQVGGQVETVLADPSGWTDVSGTPWLDIES